MVFNQCWLTSLVPFVKLQVRNIIHPTQRKSSRSMIEQFVLSWFVRYKGKVLIVQQIQNGDNILFQNDTDISSNQKLSIIVRELQETVLVQSSFRESFDDISLDYQYNYVRPTLLICHDNNPCSCRSYGVLRNDGFYSLVKFLERNTSHMSCRWQRQIIICAWFRLYRKQILYVGHVQHLSFDIVIQLLEVLLRCHYSKAQSTTSDPQPSRFKISEKSM